LQVRCRHGLRRDGRQLVWQHKAILKTRLPHRLDQIGLRLGGGLLRSPQIHACIGCSQLNGRQLQLAPVAHRHHALTQFIGRLRGFQHVTLVLQDLLGCHGFDPGFTPRRSHFQHLASILDAALQAGIEFRPAALRNQLFILGTQFRQRASQFAMDRPGHANCRLCGGDGHTRGNTWGRGGSTGVGLLPLEHIGMAALERSHRVIGTAPVGLLRRAGRLRSQREWDDHQACHQQLACGSMTEQRFHCNRSF